MLSLLVPVRGRHAKIGQMIDSYEATRTEGCSELIFRTDSDDPETTTYVESRGYKVLEGLPLGYRWLCTMYTEMATVATGSLLMCGNDDVVFLTKGWDKMFLDAAQQYPDGIFELDGDASSAWPIWPFTVTTRKVFDTLGFIYDPRVLWGDRWLHEVMTMLGRHIMVPAIKVHHDWEGQPHVQACAVYTHGEAAYHAGHAQASVEALAKLTPLCQRAVDTKMGFHVVGLPHT